MIEGLQEALRLIEAEAARYQTLANHWASGYRSECRMDLAQDLSLQQAGLDLAAGVVRDRLNAERRKSEPGVG